MTETRLCTDILADRWGILAMDHATFGHEPHDFEDSWFGRFFRRQYRCPGVVHEHEWTRIGVVAAHVDNGSRTMIVQRCDCGTERQRMLNSELLHLAEGT